MSELKWRLENGTYNALAVRHAAGEFRGPIARCADTADIIQALKANPEACAEVKAALLPLTMAGANATHDRAEQAERDLADALTLAEERLCATRQAERERDVARDCGQDGVCAIAPGCQRHWEERNRELVRENDALKAKLAEAEARCSALARSDIQSAALARLRQEEIVGLHAKHDLYRRDVENTWFAKTQAALARASAAEAVVEAAVRWRNARAACLGIRDAADALASATWVWEAHKTSAGSGAATPEGGHISKADERQLDSPVGVAATAEGPGPGPLCAQCGAPIGYCRDVCERQLSVSNGQTPEPAPPRVDPADLTEEPITLSDLSALEERLVERVARACERSSRDPHGYYPGNVVLADELRRKP